jgi:microtubule-associated protein, RP/EB family
MDALHPGSVNLSKVDFNSRSEYDSINNYKALQGAFTRVGIEKPVDVARLVKARPLDNIEFMQWFKAYWDSQTGGGNEHALSGYDARARRAASKTGDVRGGGGGGGGNSSNGNTASTSSSGDGVAAPPPFAPPFSASRAPLASRENRQTPTRGSKVFAAATTAAAATGRKAAAAGAAPTTSSTSATTVSELTAALAEARIRAAAAERERDFYFDKLRDVELLCGAPGLLLEEGESGGETAVGGAAAALKLVERVLFAADEAGAKEVLAEAGVVGATGVTPPPVQNGEGKEGEEVAS